VDGQVQTDDLADLNVTTGKLAEGAVVTTKIADLNVTTDKLAEGSVTTGKILDDNVTYAKIQDISDSDRVLGRVTAGAGVIEEISTTGNGNVVRAESPTLTTPDIGAATGTSLSVTDEITSSGTAGIGYSSGAGGAVTQITNKSTAVTINKISGQITMHNTNLNNYNIATFRVNNNTVSATDVPVVAISGGTSSPYHISVVGVGSGFFDITIINVSGGPLSEAVVINYAIIKAVND